MPGATVAQVAQDGEQPRHLVGRQAGRGLVQHDQLGLDCQRAGDGDQRVLGARKAGDARLRVDVAADGIERPHGAPPCCRPVDQPGSAREALTHGHVLGHRHPVDQAQILMDEGDRLGRAGAGRAVAIGLAAKQDLRPRRPCECRPGA